MQIAKAYTRSTGRQEPLCGSLPAGFLYSPQQMEGAGTMTVTLSLQMWKLRRGGAGRSSKVTRGARGRVRTHTRPSSGARAPGWRTPLPVPNVPPFTPRAPLCEPRLHRSRSGRRGAVARVRIVIRVQGHEWGHSTPRAKPPNPRAINSNPETH